jgi:hypothetical protein
MNLDKLKQDIKQGNLQPDNKKAYSVFEQIKKEYGAFQWLFLFPCVGGSCDVGCAATCSSCSNSSCSNNSCTVTCTPGCTNSRTQG